MPDKTFYPGTRVMVFDMHLYKNDIETPFSVTMKPATVLRWYGKRSNFGGWTDGDLIDVKFDHRAEESRGHFTANVIEI